MFWFAFIEHCFCTLLFHIKNSEVLLLQKSGSIYFLEVEKTTFFKVVGKIYFHVVLV